MKTGPKISWNSSFPISKLGLIELKLIVFKRLGTAASGGAVEKTRHKRLVLFQRGLQLERVRLISKSGQSPVKSGQSPEVLASSRKIRASPGKIRASLRLILEQSIKTCLDLVYECNDDPFRLALWSI
jgi:hypothetical protein